PSEQASLGGGDAGVRPSSGLVQRLEVRQNGLDPVPDLASLALKPRVLFFERRQPLARAGLFAKLRLRFVEPLLQRVALAAQLLNRGHGALHALVEPRQDLAFFRSGERHLFFFLFLHSTFTGSSSATRAATF